MYVFVCMYVYVCICMCNYIKIINNSPLAPLAGGGEPSFLLTNLCINVYLFIHTRTHNNYNYYL